MQQAKDRVIAIDYLRGLCILAVILSHAAVFSAPFGYVTGYGQLWTSAAEMFFLLSGATYAIIRGPKILKDFKNILLKTWRRALIIYLVYLVTVILSICLALFFKDHNLANNIPGAVTSLSGTKLLIRLLDLSYSVGWANFLMYFSVFLVGAPFAMYVLRTKIWPVVPLLSFGIFALNASHALPRGAYLAFAIWQFYFVLGMTFTRFRPQIIGWFMSLKKLYARLLAATVVGLAALVLAVSFLLNFQVYPKLVRLSARGWFPHRLLNYYHYALKHRHHIDLWLSDSRTGILRPIVAIVVFLAVYLIYQRHKMTILKYSGSFVVTMGRDTLWIFAAQALVIPIMAAFPLSRNFVSNFLMTSLLVLLMWLTTKRQSAWRYLLNFF